MVTYVQIGKGPRMAINDTVKNIRDDFVKQMPGFNRIAPVSFYKTRTTKEKIGVLLPVRWKPKGSDRVYTDFYWIGQIEWWSIWGSDGSMTKIHYGTVGWDNVMDLIKKYRSQGYEI